MKKLISVLLVLVMALAPVSAYAAHPDAETFNGLRSSTGGTVEKIESKSAEKKDEPASASEGVYVQDWDTYDMPYVIKVDRVNQLISVYEESYSGEYDVLVKRFICSTGTSGHKTPRGTFKLSDAERREWRYFKKHKVYVHNAVHIKGDYFFHGIPCKKKDLSTMDKKALKKIGTRASHGCIRMLEDDMKWIFDNCGAGTRVVIMDCKKDDDLRKSYLPNE